RQAHDAAPGRLRAGELSGTVAPRLLVVGVEVQWDEVHARPDIAGTELVDEAVAVDPQKVGPQPDHVEMPGMHAISRCERRALDGVEVCQAAIVACGEPAAPGMEPGELAELCQPEARRQVGQVVLVAV